MLKTYHSRIIYSNRSISSVYWMMFIIRDCLSTLVSSEITGHGGHSIRICSIVWYCFNLFLMQTIRTVKQINIITQVFKALDHNIVTLINKKLKRPTNNSLGENTCIIYNKGNICKRQRTQNNKKNTNS